MPSEQIFRIFFSTRLGIPLLMNHGVAAVSEYTVLMMSSITSCNGTLVYRLLMSKLAYTSDGLGLILQSSSTKLDDDVTECLSDRKGFNLPSNHLASAYSGVFTAESTGRSGQLSLWFLAVPYNLPG